MEGKKECVRVREGASESGGERERKREEGSSEFPLTLYVHAATEDFFRALYLHEEPHHNMLLKRTGLKKEEGA